MWDGPAASSPRVARRSLAAHPGGDARVHASERLPGDGRLQRPHEPDGRPLLARRARLRGREERPDQGLRQSLRPDADHLRRPEHERAQLLGSRHARLRARPRLPGEPLRVRPLRARCGDRRHRASLGHRRRALRPLPDAAGRNRGRLRHLGPALAPPGGRQHDDGARAGPDRGLVPAVSEPLDRQPRVRRGRRPLRQRRRRRELQLRRLGPGRQPAQPLRRPAGRGRRDVVSADCRGRRAAQPGSADDG